MNLHTNLKLSRGLSNAEVDSGILCHGELPLIQWV
jgi:hypothetical protein